MLVKLDTNIYDITKFHHPGGNHIMKQLRNKDVTVLYNTYHYHKELPESLKQCKVDSVQVFSKKPEYVFDSDFGKEIRALWFPGANVAPIEWWIRTWIITAAFCYFEYAYHFHNSWYHALALGTVYALIGLNIGHDASHGAVSRNPQINRFFECYMDLIGNSSFIWFRQHVIQHHPYTNESDYDPDTKAGHPLFEIETPNVYTVPFISLLGFSVMSRVTHNYYDYFMRAFLLYRIFSPLHFMNSMILIYTAGAILSGLFVISHNNDKSQRNLHRESKDWYKNQVRSSSTYGNHISGMITGGLNYQIEHHLFPKMNSCYYSVIQPLVKQICKKHDVPYHYYPNFWKNVVGFFKTVK